MHYKFFLAILCFAAGVGAHFAMAPYNMPFALFIGLPVLYYAVMRAEQKRWCFFYTWLFAFGYFVFSLSWISNALLVEGNEDFLWAYPLAIAGLPTLLALFPALCVTFITRRFNLEHPSGWYAFVFALGLSEIARGFLFTGFPWNNFAYSWTSLLPMAQVASIGGLYFLGTLTIFWATTPALFFLHKRGAPALITFVIATASLSGSYLWGLQRLQAEPVIGTPSTLVHLIQPNIGQKDKWIADKMPAHLESLVSLSQEAIKPHPNKTNLLIWPETASVNTILSREENQRALKKLLPSGAKNHLITGVLRIQKYDDKRAYYNSISLYGPGMEVTGVYDKHHLVPFGEYIPFQNLIPLKPVVNFSGFKAGAGLQKINITNAISVSPLICYEIIFPGRTLPEDKAKPNLIVNVTNDAWYGDSAGPRQHLVSAQFRAIETATPVARVANTGISALISPNGTFLTVEKYAKKGFKTHPLPLPLQNETYFAMFGHKITVALLFVIFCFSCILKHK